MREIKIPSLLALRLRDNNGLQPLQRELERRGYQVKKIVDANNWTVSYSKNKRGFVSTTKEGFRIDIIPTHFVKTKLDRHPRDLTYITVFLIVAEGPVVTKPKVRRRTIATRANAKTK